MIKLSLVLAFGFTIGTISVTVAGEPANATPAYNPDLTNPANGALPNNPSGIDSVARPSPTASPGSTGSTNANPSYEGSDVEGDDTLYRAKTRDSLAAGLMSHDEGQLTRKPRAREKVAVVDSTKKLPSSGTDPKFQGNLLQSTVTSIEDVGAKPNQDGKVQPQSAPRPQRRHQVFNVDTSDESKKTESTHAATDSSPSPTPSPTVSPSGPNR